MLVSLDEYDRDWPPFYYRSLFHRFGLYSGRVVSPYIRTIYFEALSHRFLEPAVAALEADLKSFNPSAPPSPISVDSTTSTTPSLSSAEAAEERLGQYYDLLKVYWMVSRYPKRAVPSLLIERLGDHWKESAPREDEALALSQLEFFANSVALDDAPHVEAKEETVRTSCIKLESFPAMNRYYKRAIDDISSTTREVTLDELLGGKKGLVEGTARVKGAFTSEGYKKMLTAIEEAETGIRQEDWVCHNAPSSNDQRDIKLVKSQYAGQYSKQYIDAWRKFLKDAKVAEYTQDGAARTLEELSKNDSPLERVMGEVARQTNLYKPSSFWARINPFSAHKSEIGSAIAKNIETECQSVIKFVSSEGGISQYRQLLTDVRNALNENAATDEWPQVAKRLLAANSPKSLSTFESQQKPMLQVVKGGSGVGVEAVTFLEQPLANLRKLLVSSNMEQMEREWRENLLPAAQRLEQGYPFASLSASDAPITEVARFFNPADGQLWGFYKLNLASYFTEADGVLKQKEGSKIKLSDSFIGYLNKAKRLTDALFPPNGKSPGFTFGLALQSSPGVNSTIEMQVEGQRIDASTPPLNIKWSGASGATITVSQGLGQPQTKPFSGWWALFKMFEEGGGSATRTSDNQYALGWRVQGTTVRAKLQPPGTTNNPFDLRLFKELRAPQSTQ
jgi:type VI protein secretion system component VasK